MTRIDKRLWRVAFVLVLDTVIAGSLFLRGVGAAMISTPVMTIVYRRVSKALLPRAAVALNLLGGSVGTAVLAVVLQAGGPGQAAFGDAFWWVLGLAAAAATRLPRSIHDHEKDAADA